MNIFVLDKSPEEAAKMHYDKHVVKMILETSQILQTVLSLKGAKTVYKQTHISHPCVKWAGKSISNFRWLERLLIALNKEYMFRYNKGEHASFTAFKNCSFCLEDYDWPETGQTEFALAMPDEFKGKDAVSSYRNYYLTGKTHLVSYKKRKPPQWLVSSIRAQL